MRKLCSLFLLFSVLFSLSVFAEQSSPYVIEQQEDGRLFAFEMEGYEEYIKEYKASQTTETIVMLPSGEDITISTKGVFRIYNAAVLSPEYIKIKEHNAASLKKGDCIYFELNKGRFLKDISAITTQGDMKATAVGNGSYIKLEITQTSTVPSEITLNRIMILPEGKNENSAAKSEFVLSLTSKYINGDNLFHNTKQNHLMVPLRSLYHVFIVDNHYCETHVLNPSINVYHLNWDTEQKIASIGNNNYYSISFQNNSNTMTVIHPYRGELTSDTITLPVAAEIKNDTIYVPLCAETAGAILRWDISKYMHWDDTAKTMLIEH